MSPPYGSPTSPEAISVFAADGFGVALVTGDHRWVDAHLIASAPAMLALLREYRNQIRPGEYIEDGELDDLTKRIHVLVARLDGAATP